ncbi:hypothetical protein ACLB0R_11295 [Sphingomonas sp. GlSt437]|uniref:hypothetical protein n=1 Tax=Sphingomonas sp. GlSt437 TaxID=3389970 RepID=UPI003A8B0124
MSDGGWVVLGAAIGTAGSVATTWLTALLERRSEFPDYDKAVCDLLRKILSKPNDTWQNIQTLSRVTGLRDNDIKEYLIQIGARGSTKNGELWRLIENDSSIDINIDP